MPGNLPNLQKDMNIGYIKLKSLQIASTERQFTKTFKNQTVKTQRQRIFKAAKEVYNIQRNLHKPINKFLSRNITDQKKIG